VTFAEVVALAFALAVDAFAVAIAVSLSLGSLSKRQVLRLSWHFGFFQAAMPVLGWLAGSTIADWVAPIDHWVAFTLLALLGVKMLKDARAPDEKEALLNDPTKGWRLVLLSVATSIDALAVGLSLAFLQSEIWWPALIIGVVAFCMTALGMSLGVRLGKRFGHAMEATGGLVLLAIGVKILSEHLLS
jgi:putative Mn2+ efflux pump MntP